MRVLVVYESMYGNTHLVAEEIARGLRAARLDVTATVVPVADATAALVGDADVVVVGGPTHVHGMASARTRHAAADAAAKPGSTLTMDADAEGPGLREWFDTLERMPVDAAAFDTRLKGPPIITGRASRGIAKRLRHHGATLVVPPESFLVTRDSELAEHEGEHARMWGAHLAGALVHS
jgi:hypothetical protein